MSTEPPLYEYRLGFRYASKASSTVERGSGGRPHTAKSDRIRCLQGRKSCPTHYTHRPLETRPAGCNLVAVRQTTDSEISPLDCCSYHGSSGKVVNKACVSAPPPVYTKCVSDMFVTDYCSLLTAVEMSCYCYKGELSYSKS